MFFDSFTLFAAAVDQLADQITAAAAAGAMPRASSGGGATGSTAPNGGTPRAGGFIDATSPDRKLLVLLSNCAFVRSSVLPGLTTR